MSQYKQFEDIKDMFNLVKIPEIDLKEKVRRKIEMDTPMHNHKMPYRKVVLLSLVFMCILSIGALAKSGVFASFLNNINNLKQGESATWTFFNTYNNKKETLYFNKAVTINNLEELKVTIGDGFVYPEYLPDGYTFKEGGINYFSVHNNKPDDKNINEEQYEFNKIETTNNISGYTLIFSNGINPISIRVVNLDNNQEYILEIPDDERDIYSIVEETNVIGNKAIYSVIAGEKKFLTYRDGTYKTENVEGRQELQWANDKCALVLMSDSQSGINKEGLISIAESIKISE